jgi:hypothetical protein
VGREFVGDLVGDRNEGCRAAQQPVAQPQRRAHRRGRRREPGPRQAGAEELARELADGLSALSTTGAPVRRLASSAGTASRRKPDTSTTS